MKKHSLVLMVILLAGSATRIHAQSGKHETISDRLYSIIRKEGIEEAVQKYKNLRVRSGKHDLDESELNKLGYKLMEEGKPEEAAVIFDLNIHYHPESVNAYDSRNDALLKLGRYDEAARNYRKILVLLEEQNLADRQERFLKNKARINLFRVEHFSPPAEGTFNYVGFYGGIPAGLWDMENVTRFHKTDPQLSLSYTGNNLYFRPIPANTAQTFNGPFPVDVATGFIGGYLHDFIRRGDLVDITELWAAKHWDARFPPPFRRLAACDGRKYFVPMAYQWNPIWYRKDVFQKYHLKPPGSWDELLDLCDRLHDLGYTPFSISVQNWPPPVARWFSILDIRLNGPDFHRQVLEGAVSFRDKRIRKVFEHWQTLFRHHAFSDSSYAFNYSDGIRALTAGKAVMYNLGEWIFESLNEDQAQNLDFFAFPAMNPAVPSSEIVHVYGAYMTKRSTHPGKARALLAYLAGTESQTSNATTNHRIVANSSVDSSAYTSLQRRIVHHIDKTDRLVPLFEFSTRPEFGQKALEIFQEFWKNPEDIDRTLDKLERARITVFG